MWGPYRHQTREGFKFFLTVVDDHTRTTWVTLLKQTSDSFFALQKFIVLAKTQFERQVKIIRSDNALEFKDSQCKTLYDLHGITHQTTCVDRAQQNGRCERKHRNVLEMARCLRIQAGLPKCYWGDCVLTSAYLTNRLPTVTLHNKTPYEALHHKKPSYSSLKPFGCLALAYNPSRDNDKMNPRGIPFLGYPACQKGYKLLNLFTKQTFVSRDIKWFEHTFPYTLTHTQLNHLIPTTPDVSIHHAPVWEDSSEDESDYDPAPNRVPTLPTGTPTPHPDTSPSPHAPPDTTPPLRRSDRAKTTPARLSDYITPIANSTSTCVTPKFHCFLTQLHHNTDPISFFEASKHPHWVAAMNEELSALEANHTWVIINLPLGKQAIGSKWLLKTKYQPDGSIERHKARLVIMGNRQKYGVDYVETFALVAKLTTVRALLAIAAIDDWQVFQLDVKNAFLHRDLNEHVYMKFPQGY